MSSKLLVFTAVFMGLFMQAEANFFRTTKNQHLERAREHYLAKYHKALSKNSSSFKIQSLNNSNNAADTHILFSSHQDAIDWFKTNASWLAKGLGGDKFDVLDLSDSRYAVLQSYAHDLWKAYTEIYPVQTAGLNEPPVILVDTPVVNAFVTKDPKTNKAIHAIVVLTGFIDQMGGVQSREKISGVIGHELAHSVFRHILSEYADKINKFYDSTQVKMGYLAERNDSLDNVMKEWLGNAELAGELSLNELLDLPSPTAGQSFGFEILRQIRKDFFNNGPQCADALNQLKGWSSLFSFSALDSDFEIVDNNFVELKSQSQKTIDKMTVCIGDRKKSLAEIMSEILGLPAEVFESDPEFAATAKDFDNAADTTSGLRAIIHAARSVMQKVEASVDFKKLGSYTFEENADDHSVIVHAYMNGDATALKQSFIEFTPPEVYQACRQIIDSGKSPKQGTFADPHRADCYRIYQIEQLTAAMPKERSGIREFAKEYSRSSHDSDWAANTSPLTLQ